MILDSEDKEIICINSDTSRILNGSDVSAGEHVTHDKLDNAKEVIQNDERIFSSSVQARRAVDRIEELSEQVSMQEGVDNRHRRRLNLRREQLNQQPQQLG